MVIVSVAMEIITIDSELHRPPFDRGLLVLHRREVVTALAAEWPFNSAVQTTRSGRHTTQDLVRNLARLCRVSRISGVERFKHPGATVTASSVRTEARIQSDRASSPSECICLRLTRRETTTVLLPQLVVPESSTVSP